MPYLELVECVHNKLMEDGQSAYIKRIDNTKNGKVSLVRGNEILTAWEAQFIKQNETATHVEIRGVPRIADQAGGDVIEFAEQCNQ